MLEKLVLRYDPAEDRLVLTIHAKGSTASERRIMQLTRRTSYAWRLDMAAMLRLAEQEPQSAYAAQLAPVRKARAGSVDLAAVPLERARAEDPTQTPPGSPALVSRITCARRRSDGRWLLKFQVRGAESFSLTLSDKALQDLMAGLQHQLKQADWSLPPLADTEESTKPSRSRPLH